MEKYTYVTNDSKDVYLQAAEDGYIEESAILAWSSVPE